MGLSDMIATSIGDYVGRAVEAATNITHRLALSQRILSRVDQLYEDESVVWEWEELLRRLVQTASS